MTMSLSPLEARLRWGFKYFAGHTVTPAMERDAVDWFRRQLLGAAQHSRAAM